MGKRNKTCSPRSCSAKSIGKKQKRGAKRPSAKCSCAPGWSNANRSASRSTARFCPMRKPSSWLNNSIRSKAKYLKFSIHETSDFLRCHLFIVPQRGQEDPKLGQKAALFLCTSRWRSG